MNSLVALDPLDSNGKTFGRFCEAVSLFQREGFISSTTLVSAIHASLYPVPTSWYRELKVRYAKEALERTKAACEGRFDFQNAKVLQSDSSANEDLVAQISRFGKTRDCDLLVVGSNNRTGLPHWLLGSFAETAALSSVLPVLIVKPHWKESAYSREFRILVTVDVLTPPTKEQIRWIAKATRGSRAKVDLVHALPRPRILTEAVRPALRRGEAEATLERVRKELRSEGVVSETHLVDETRSLAHALSEFADKRKSWLTVTAGSPRPLPYRLLLGSTARRILSLTERPFVSLRLDR